MLMNKKWHFGLNMISDLKLNEMEMESNVAMNRTVLSISSIEKRNSVLPVVLSTGPMCSTRARILNKRMSQFCFEDSNKLP